MPETRARRPLITANRVTVARLIPLPLCAWMLYQNPTWFWVAFWVGSLVAMTDFIDGYLARQQGPTVLGGLLDPIADKVFISAFFLPLVDMHLIPAWTVALMFVREFVVTAIRSAYKQRGLSLKTSYFAKVKTWVQMQAVFFMMLVLLLEPRQILLIVVALAVGGSLVLTLVVSIMRRRLFVSGVIMAVACAAAGALYWLFPERECLSWTMYVTVGITWLSGADYLLSALPTLRKAKDWGRADAVRLIGAVTLPVLAVVVLLETSAPTAPILVLVALELAVGGLDNLLSHHKRAARALSWSARVLGASVLLAAALALDEWTGLDAFAVNGLVWAAMVASAIGVGIEFWRGRDVYLDDEPPDAAEADALDS